MNNRFMTGVIAGGLLGATAGMYALNRTTPKQRRKMMRKGARIARNATRVMDAMDFLK